jgi:thiosulfate reductase/polysulfide reductase chain A
VGGIGFHQDADRLAAPRIRTGERGEGVFRTTSWNEANAEIGRRLRAVIDAEGPGAVAFLTHGAAETHFEHLAAAIGTPHHAHPAYDQCKAPREVGFRLTFGHALASPEPVDIENTNCLVLIGSHLGENMHNLQVQEMVTASTRGASLIVVDPRRSTAAERADAWLQIRPGTDIALLLAWLHVLIRDGAYDHGFVAEHTSGFDELAAHVERSTPEWAAAETGLAEADIERSAALIAEAGPHMALHPGRHVVWYGNDTQRARAMAILVAITGAWGSRGGYYLPQRVAVPGIEEVFPDLPELPEMDARRDPGYPFSTGVNVNGIRQATRDGKIKAWVVVGTNLLTTLPAQHETIEALQALDLLVVVDVLPTEITQYADVLLPAAGYLERADGLCITGNRDAFVALMQEATEPLAGSRPEDQIARDIGEALGLGRYWAWTSANELAEARIEHHNRTVDPAEAVDWDTLRDVGFVVVDDSSPIYRAGHGLGADGSGRAGAELSFPSFSGDGGDGRVQLYSTDLAETWNARVADGDDPTGFEPLPTYYPPAKPPPGHVRLVYGRSPVHSFGRTQNTPVLHGRDPENEVWASPEVAAGFGLDDDDLVELVNQDGARQGPVHLKITARMSSDAVYVTHGFGRNSRQLTNAYRRGVDDSALMTKYALDPLCGGTAMRVNFVRLVKPNAV